METGERQFFDSTGGGSQANARCIIAGCAFAKTLPAAIFIFEKGRVVYANPAAEELTGWSAQELSRMDLRETVAETDRQRRGDPDAPPHDEIRFHPKSGEDRWADLYTMEAQSDGRPATIAVAFDITGRKKAEEERRASEIRYADLFAGSPDAAFISTLDGRFLDLNPAALELIGYGREEAIGVNAHDICASPEDQARFQNAIAQNGRVKDLAVMLRRKNGETRQCLVSASLWQGAHLETLGYQGMIRDVTEKRRLAEELRQAEKFAAVGRTTAPLAHRVKGILSRLTGSSALMNDKLSAGGHSDLKELWGIFSRATHELSALTRDMLAVSAPKGPAREENGLNDLVRAKVREYEHFARLKGVALHLEPSEADSRVPFDPKAMGEALSNVLENAIDACCATPRACVTIRTGEDPELKVARIWISDNGPGVPEEEQDRIFDPFFSTKGHGGSGLGLPIARKIMLEHHGALSLDSRPGETIFTFELPLGE